VLLAGSIGVKVAANAAPPGPNAAAFDAAAVAMLANAGFTTSREARPFGTLVHGTRGTCRVVVAEYDPHGTFDRLLRELAAPVGPLRFAWQGRVSDGVPRRQALIRFYVWRELRRVRIAVSREPLAAWAATPGCDSSSLDWHRLASIPT
jgi:hypothetical protein